MGESLVQRLVKKYGAERLFAMLTPAQQSALRYEWEAMARPEQLPPDGEWTWLLYLAGRGFGKTRSGAEWSRMMAKRMPGSRGFFLHKTADDARAVMVEGESGLLACCPPAEKPEWKPSLKGGGVLLFPNGTEVQIYSAFSFDDLRGPQHHWGWMEELAAWDYPTEAFDMAAMGLRLGEHPQCVITTTPRPISVIRRLVKDPACVIRRGSTYDNAANLPQSFLNTILQKYEGTRLGRQELMGELLEDVPGALWSRAMFEWDGFRIPAFHVDEHGRAVLKVVVDLDYVVVAIDPAVTASEDSDETGIVVAARVASRDEARYMVLEDGSMRGTPDQWARKAVALMDKWGANRIVAEVNNGGDMVEHVLRAVRHSVPYKAVHASRAKRTRAEPVAALYEQKRVQHVGQMDNLEDQMCLYVPGEVEKSPDRMDALVWAVTELTEGRKAILV